MLLTQSLQAILDMLVSFADVVALSTESYVRPILMEAGPMIIRNGRHPIVCKLPIQRLNGLFVPNDILISDLERFQIITGPNGSGKVRNNRQLNHHHII
jgi:DNA mismatch repair protein MutS